MISGVRQIMGSGACFEPWTELEAGPVSVSCLAEAQAEWHFAEARGHREDPSFMERWQGDKPSRNVTESHATLPRSDHTQHPSLSLSLYFIFLLSLSQFRLLSVCLHLSLSVIVRHCQPGLLVLLSVELRQSGGPGFSPPAVVACVANVGRISEIKCQSPRSLKLDCHGVMLWCEFCMLFGSVTSTKNLRCSHTVSHIQFTWTNKTIANCLYRLYLFI